jgi:hypothetical protein
VAFENQDTTLIDLSGNEIQFKDAVQSTSLKLNDLLPFYQYGNASSETSTTSTTVWSTKITLTTPSLRIGTYKIYWSTKWRTAAANREIDVRITDGTTTLHESRHSLLRLQGTPNLSGYTVVAGISGVKNFYLEFKVGGTATTAYLSDSWLDVKRVIKT